MADEFGTPTSVADLAEAIVALVGQAPGGVYHLVNAGHTTRLGYAQRVLANHGRTTPFEPIRQVDFQRPSTPPAWGVLSTDRAAAAGVRLRSWESALDSYSAATDAVAAAGPATPDGAAPSPAGQEASTEASRGLS